VGKPLEQVREGRRLGGAEPLETRGDRLASLEQRGLEVLAACRGQFDDAAATIARDRGAANEPRVDRVIDEPTRPSLRDTDRLGDLDHAQPGALRENSEHAVTGEPYE